MAGEDPGDRSRGAEWGLSVGYQSGPMNFAVVYDEVKSISAREFGTFASAFQAVPTSLSQLYNLSGNEKARRIAAAGSYAFGNVKVFAGYRYLNTDALTRVDGAGADKFRSDLYWLGATWQATPAMGLTVAAYHSNNKRNPSVTSYVLGVDYKMSKRTDLYTNLSYADNRAKSGIESAQSVDAGRTTPAGKDQFGAQVGIRHWF
ncbi:MAG: porin [Candidatus Protistobacter heckmanni]|nr:porin [Candidatus Protistobacter heckmanni]